MAPRLHLYDGLAAHTYAVRLFILERGGFDITVQSIDVLALENRKAPYTTLVNPRGEVPALRITTTPGAGDKSDSNDDAKTEFILTEVPAIYEYLDEIALGGSSLFGDTALERAETRMWLRRMDLYVTRMRRPPPSVVACSRHFRPLPFEVIEILKQSAQDLRG